MRSCALVTINKYLCKSSLYLVCVCVWLGELFWFFCYPGVNAAAVYSYNVKSYVALKRNTQEATG